MVELERAEFLPETGVVIGSTGRYTGLDLPVNRTPLTAMMVSNSQIATSLLCSLRSATEQAATRGNCQLPALPSARTGTS